VLSVFGYRHKDEFRIPAPPSLGSVAPGASPDFIRPRLAGGKFPCNRPPSPPPPEICPGSRSCHLTSLKFRRSIPGIFPIPQCGQGFIEFRLFVFKEAPPGPFTPPFWSGHYCGISSHDELQKAPQFAIGLLRSMFPL